MSQAKKMVDRGEFDLGRARVLGRGLGALKGVRLSAGTSCRRCRDGCRR
jgi:hypothetical protein